MLPIAEGITQRPTAAQSQLLIEIVKLLRYHANRHMTGLQYEQPMLSPLKIQFVCGEKLDDVLCLRFDIWAKAHRRDDAEELLSLKLVVEKGY